MKLSDIVTKKIITRLIKGQDYRIEIVSLINANFLQYTIDFFKKIVDAKLKNKDITVDWYKKEFLKESLKSNDIAIHSGLNKKTISNMYNSATKEIVIKASNQHYEELYNAIQTLVDNEEDINITLTIKFNGISVDLSVNESLIVINSLAVKRAALRGGLWSTAGKAVEKPLMLTLCKLYNVSEKNYALKVKNEKKSKKGFEREIDFYLKNGENKYKCEVKLMGKGNPESADAIFARQSAVFVGDKLSAMNKKQAEYLGVQWVELRTKDGYRRFQKVLDFFKIPHKNFRNKVSDELLEEIYLEIFK